MLLQAVANATAKAMVSLASNIECWSGEEVDYYVALLSAKADALANDVQVAIDSVFKSTCLCQCMLAQHCFLSTAKFPSAAKMLGGCCVG